MPSKTVIAIICITILMTIALVKDIDGAALASGLAVLAGLGGWAAHKKKEP